MMSLPEVLEELGIPTAPAGHHHTTEGWVNIDCVACSPGTGRFKLGIHLSGGVANCWSCGPTRVVEALSLASNRPVGEILPLLCHLRPSQQAFLGSPRGRLVLPEDIGPLLPAHTAYLKGRGLDPEAAEKVWGVRGIGNAPKLGWRLFIPVTFDGKVVSWTTRSISKNASLRYVGAKREQEAIPKSSLLYGEDLAEGHAVVVCEGPLDVWAVGPGAVATFGIAFSRVQAMRLGRWVNRTVVFDSEPEAQRRAEKLCRMVSGLPGRTRQVMLQSGKDAASCDPQELQELRRKYL